jgi:chitin synthase
MTSALRPAKAGRRTRLAISITLYNEEGDELARTLEGIAANLPGLAKAHGVHWSEVLVVACIDGRERMSASMLDYVTHGLRLYDAGILTLAHRGRPVTMHVFERTVELPRHAAQREYHFPLQLVLAVKERNGGKLNSHLWFFTGFCRQLDPLFCALLDVGTVPWPDAMGELVGELGARPDVAGACGEIRVRDVRRWHPLDASQSLEYAVVSRQRWLAGSLHPPPPSDARPLTPDPPCLLTIVVIFAR